MPYPERAGRGGDARSKRMRRRRRRRIKRILWAATVVALLGALIWILIGSGIIAFDFVRATPAPAATAVAADPTPEAGDPTPEAEPTPDSTPPPPTPTPEPTPPPTPTPIPTPEPTPVIHKYPYYIEVDRGKQVVTVFTIDEVGEYRHIARQMICSTDTFNRKPPNGVYRLDGEHKRWLTTVATPRSYAQYATRIASKILFHSIPYKTQRPDNMDAKAYADLGTNASIGCIRLLCADAKWIYDNVPAGTPVRFLTTERDTALLERLAPPPLIGGKWDPTDPDDRNPDFDSTFSRPEVTPWLGVTPAPTPAWKAATYK